MRTLLNLKLIILNILLCSPIYSQFIDDVSVRYGFLRINEVKVGDMSDTPTFERHITEVVFGKGQMTFGAIFQRATKPASTLPGVPENGFMLTATYDKVISEQFRIKTGGKLAAFSDINPGQPLYAADTEVYANAVWFSADGIGIWMDESFFPSAYVGSIVNRYGRVQAVSGVGTWWNNIGTYLTAYHAFNGVEDPMNPGDDADIRFAYLKNSGVTFSMSYDWKNLRFWGKRNFPIKNAGNDLAFTIEYQYYLSKGF